MQRSRRVIHWIAPFARCWILNQIAKSVAVYHRDGSALVYGPGATIPLDAFGCSETSPWTRSSDQFTFTIQSESRRDP